MITTSFFIQIRGLDWLWVLVVLFSAEAPEKVILANNSLTTHE